VRGPSTWAHAAYVDRVYLRKRDSHLFEPLGRLGRLSREQSEFFLHIPKTGGTAVSEALRSIRSQSSSDSERCTPLKLTHRRSFVAFHDNNLARSKFSFVFRDPTDRYISGFFEAMRQGRPYVDLGRRTWSAGEFAAFNWFKEPNDLFEALGSSDDRTLSAAVSTFRTIPDLRWDHVWMLGTVEEFNARRGRIRHFCPIDRLHQDFPRFLDPAVRLESSVVEASLKPVRSAPHRVCEVSVEARHNLRAFRSEEYRLYEHLCELYEAE